MRVSITQAGLALSLGSALLMSGCSGGSGGSTAASATFEVVSINVINSQEWQINRAIDILFNQDVDFATVNSNTINIADDQGRGATGVILQRLGPTPPTAAEARPMVRAAIRALGRQRNEAGFQYLISLLFAS